MLQCAPNADDLESIAPFKEAGDDPDMLAQVERFFYEVSDVPFFKDRLTALLHKQQFPEQARDILSDIETVVAACCELLHSSAIPWLLAAVLQVGNVLNDGSNWGAARGFDIEILPKLEFVKSGDNKTTLLQFIAQLVEEEGDRQLQVLRHERKQQRKERETFEMKGGNPQEDKSQKESADFQGHQGEIEEDSGDDEGGGVAEVACCHQYC